MLKVCHIHYCIRLGRKITPFFYMLKNNMYKIRIELRNNSTLDRLTFFILIFLEASLNCESSYFADNEYLIALHQLK